MTKLCYKPGDANAWLTDWGSPEGTLGHNVLKWAVPAITPVINMTCHGWGEAPAVISRQKAQAPLSWCTWQPSQKSRKECCALHTKTVYRQVCLLAGPSRCQRLLHRSGTSTAQQLVRAKFNLPVHVLVTDRSEKGEPKTKLRPDFTLPHL